MNSAASTVESDDFGRLWVRLRGRVETDEVDRVSTDLLERLEAMGAGGQIIVDMHEMESVSTKARLRLTDLQRGIATHRARTAFVADRPRFRGVGLFVAHTSGDPNARAFHGLEPAQAWLTERAVRMERLVDWRDQSLRGNKRRSPPRRSSDELRLRVAKLRESQDEEESSDE